MADPLQRLAETLLPGGAGFPPFAGTGAGPLLHHRLPPASHARLAETLAAHGPPPDTPAAWTEAASRLEALEPSLFADIRKAAYLAYYEQPEVIEAIRALGHPYNLSPLPDGYPAPPFDPEQDAPRHRRGRGRWIDTDDVRPLDLSGLGLECPR